MRLRILSAALACVLLAGCQDATTNLPSIAVKETDIEFRVPAEGEVIAAEALTISLPGSLRMWFNIAWLVPEFTEVKAGDVIARFDDVQVQIDQSESKLAVARSDFKLDNTDRVGSVEHTRISHETARIEGERAITEYFEDVDETLFSRNEIIDALSDIEYLDVAGAYLNWQFSTFDQRSAAEKNLILAERQGAQSKLETQQLALGMMELRSPADGTFVYAKTPWGDKIGKGQSLMPGRPVGLLPVRGKVKARLYVPEADAVGLAIGQAVSFRLDSAPEREFTARIESVSSVASPRNRDDPQKFFQVEAAIDEVDIDLMRVGSRLRAEIVTAQIDDGLVVPVQAVFGDNDHAYVFLAHGSSGEKRKVSLGQRSPNLVEITAGLEAGDRISLTPPPEVE